MPILQNPLNKETLKRLAGDLVFQRGLHYYKQNRIKEFSITNGEIVRAKVKGSNLYSSNFNLKEGNIVNYDCNCPAGGFCKHLVAAALKLLDRFDSSFSNQDLKTSQVKEELPDLNTDFSLIVLGILGLYGSQINRDELIKLYKLVAVEKRSSTELSTLFSEYKQFYTNLRIFKSNEWFLDRMQAITFITAALESKYRDPIIKAVKSHLDKTHSKNPYWSQLKDYYYSRLNFSFYMNDDTAFQSYIATYLESSKYIYEKPEASEMIFSVTTCTFTGFNYSKLLAKKPYFQKLLIKTSLNGFVEYGVRTQILNSIIENEAFLLGTQQEIEFSLSALLWDLRIDKLEEITRTLSEKLDNPYYLKFFEASALTLRGLYREALDLFEEALKLERKISRNSQNTVTNSTSIFYILLLLKFDKFKNKNKIKRCISKSRKANAYPRFNLIEQFLEYSINPNPETLKRITILSTNIESHSEDWLFIALYSFFLYFIDESILANLKIHIDQNILNKHPAFTLNLLKDTLKHIDENNALKIKLPEHINQSNLVSLINLFEKTSVWESKLELLKRHFNLNDSNIETHNSYRFVWILDVSKKKLLLKKQNPLKRGGWSVGQNYTLNAYTQVSDKDALLSIHDQNIINLFADDYHDYDDDDNDNYSDALDYSNMDKAILMLCGLKNVYSDMDAYNKIELVYAKPSIEVKNSKEGFYRIKLSHDFNNPQVFLERVEKNVYSVVDCSVGLLKLKAILGSSGIDIPVTAEDQIKKILKAAEADLEVISELEYENLPVLPSANKLHALVFFDAYNFTLKLELLMNPANDGVNLVIPATGRELYKITKNNGEKFICKRDFRKEKELLKTCLESLELQNSVSKFDGIDACLDIISALESFKKNNPDSIDIEWKQDEKIKVVSRTGFNSLNIKVKSKNNWFEYSGEIKLDEDKVVNINEILSNLSNSSGSYVKLNTGEFLGLTEELKKSLQKLKYISDSSENKLHKLAMSSIQDLEKAGANISKDKIWNEYLDKIKSFNKLKINIPKNFIAQLRDYQYEGFVWLSRLAYLGAGACLADDMGLGKTVQTIPVLINQAKEKPCMVVAPTSVVNNWQSEMEKFTSGLNSFVLSDYGTQDEGRKELISSLKAGDVLLCSYGLLQTQIDLLRDIDFGMVVLDESQAIKNPITKRAQAAKELKSDFRLVLSGTPIENNLTELWSQFDFINPGLLSSLKNFQGKFANAIEINKDKVAQASLKQLIQPYILRRTKDEVLRDLPPKIEQTIKIEFDADEAAFYEVLRKKAVEKLESSDESNLGKRKLMILAEMSKLRRACCHPSLVDAPGEYIGSKNKEFFELVTNLKSNGHKALVFSQYTSYLKILTKVLDMMELNYLYLDGSTPAKKRKDLVKEFQEGSADLFLLSLKAGGSGLNLTEADYVIHLDPWWNPAVEDQATDRAHRIGQHKTVNVYRLIMKSSIEEKILKLHDTKRELADELLDEANITARISDKELLDMMKG